MRRDDHIRRDHSGESIGVRGVGWVGRGVRSGCLLLVNRYIYASIGNCFLLGSAHHQHTPRGTTWVTLSLYTPAGVCVCDGCLLFTIICVRRRKDARFICHSGVQTRTRMRQFFFAQQNTSSHLIDTTYAHALITR